MMEKYGVDMEEEIRILRAQMNELPKDSKEREALQQKIMLLQAHLQKEKV
jgi:hypothetical protein